MTHLSNWLYFDCDEIKKKGLTAEEAYEDYDLLKRAAAEFQERYDFDATNATGCVYNVKNQHILKNVNLALIGNNVNFIDRVIIANNEQFNEFYKDPALYGWEKIGPKYYSHLTYVDGKEIIKNTMNFLELSNSIINMIINEYHCPMSLNVTHQMFHPVEQWSFNRGLKIWVWT